MTAEGVEAFLEGRVLVLTGDITIQRVDAIVNAANPTLLGGGGVDGAIHKAGGPEILAACQELRRTQYPQGLRTGKAVITTAGRLASRYVIHTVGPVKGRHGQRDAEFLALCYRNALELAVQYKLNSLAFPAISTGMYGYPREEAAVIASTTIASVLKDVPSLREVRLVFFSRSDLAVFLKHQIFDARGRHLPS